MSLYIFMTTYIPFVNTVKFILFFLLFKKKNKKTMATFLWLLQFLLQEPFHLPSFQFSPFSFLFLCLVLKRMKPQ